MSNDVGPKLKCPKCQVFMEQVQVDEVTLDRCTACKGIWFDVDEHATLLAREGTESVDVGSPAQGARHDDEREIDCPRCATRMIRSVAHKRQDIHYEQCGQCHGTFFDAGEFTALHREKGFIDILMSVFSSVRRQG